MAHSEAEVITRLQASTVIADKPFSMETLMTYPRISMRTLFLSAAFLALPVLAGTVSAQPTPEHEKLS